MCINSLGTISIKKSNISLIEIPRATSHLCTHFRLSSSAQIYARILKSSTSISHALAISACTSPKTVLFFSPPSNISARMNLRNLAFGKGMAFISAPA
jgi:hypothetical protein